MLSLGLLYSFQKAIIHSERQRRLKRLEAHYKNDVWEKRKEPPPDWNKPLPESMQKEYQGTYLQMKADEMKQPDWNPEPERTFCTIS